MFLWCKNLVLDLPFNLICYKKHLQKGFRFLNCDILFISVTPFIENGHHLELALPEVDVDGLILDKGGGSDINSSNSQPQVGILFIFVTPSVQNSLYLALSKVEWIFLEIILILKIGAFAAMSA